jgi:hypothetical protein
VQKVSLIAEQAKLKVDSLAEQSRSQFEFFRVEMEVRLEAVEKNRVHVVPPPAEPQGTHLPKVGGGTVFVPSRKLTRSRRKKGAPDVQGPWDSDLAVKLNVKDRTQAKRLLRLCKYLQLELVPLNVEINSLSTKQLQRLNFANATVGAYMKVRKLQSTNKIMTSAATLVDHEYAPAAPAAPRSPRSPSAHED